MPLIYNSPPALKNLTNIPARKLAIVFFYLHPFGQLGAKSNQLAN